MTTRIAMYLEEAESCSMKSMEMEFYGFNRMELFKESIWLMPWNLCACTGGV